ncbi:hypothetical protein [uncultured Ilyobacter sp.]|uniref:hypothetical protein n=1 Tax=uncultured Ilyobacter sp. TaxID=544433 RepID=UPI00374A093A
MESSKRTYDQSSGQVTVPGKYTARGKNKNEIFKGLEVATIPSQEILYRLESFLEKMLIIILKV